jgi:hypothetical protein
MEVDVKEYNKKHTIFQTYTDQNTAHAITDANTQHNEA